MAFGPQKFSLPLGGKLCKLRLYWSDAPQGSWLMDIAGANDAPLLSGLPLVSGCDLLGQHGYLGLGGELWMDTELPPGPDNLGRESKLILVAR